MLLLRPHSRRPARICGSQPPPQSHFRPRHPGSFRALTPLPAPQASFLKTGFAQAGRALIRRGPRGREAGGATRRTGRATGLGSGGLGPGCLCGAPALFPVPTAADALLRPVVCLSPGATDPALPRAPAPPGVSAQAERTGAWVDHAPRQAGGPSSGPVGARLQAAAQLGLTAAPWHPPLPPGAGHCPPAPTAAPWRRLLRPRLQTQASAGAEGHVWRGTLESQTPRR